MRNCFNTRERPESKSSLIYFYLWSSDLLDSLDCLPFVVVIIASFSNPSDVAMVEFGLSREWRLDGYQQRLRATFVSKSYLASYSAQLAGTIVALVINIPAGFTPCREKDLFEND